MIQLTFSSTLISGQKMRTWIGLPSSVLAEKNVPTPVLEPARVLGTTVAKPAEVEVLRSPVSGAIVLGIQEFPLVTTGSWVAELGILVPE